MSGGGLDGAVAKLRVGGRADLEDDGTGMQADDSFGVDDDVAELLGGGPGALHVGEQGGAKPVSAGRRPDDSERRRAQVAREKERVNVTRVLVVDDDQAFRHSVCSIVGAGDRPNVVAGADSLNGARRRLAVGAFDVAIVGSALPDGSGVDLLKEIARSRADAPMTIVAVFGDKARLLAGLEAASASWARSAGEVEGGPAQAPAFGLSEREVEVLQLVAKGFTASQAAELLGLSSHTTATHVKHIYRKLGVKSRASCIYEASRAGLIT